MNSIDWMALISWCSIWYFTQINIPDSKVRGTNVGPTRGRRDPDGPHVGHTNFAIWVYVSISRYVCHVVINGTPRLKWYHTSSETLTFSKSWRFCRRWVWYLILCIFNWLILYHIFDITLSSFCFYVSLTLLRINHTLLLAIYRQSGCPR